MLPGQARYAGLTAYQTESPQRRFSRCLRCYNTDLPSALDVSVFESEAKQSRNYKGSANFWIATAAMAPAMTASGGRRHRVLWRAWVTSTRAYGEARSCYNLNFNSTQPLRADTSSGPVRAVLCRVSSGVARLAACHVAGELKMNVEIETLVLRSRVAISRPRRLNGRSRKLPGSCPPRTGATS